MAVILDETALEQARIDTKEALRTLARPWTYAQVAELADVPATTISSFLSRGTIGNRRLARVQRALVEIGALVAGDESAQEGADLPPAA